VGMRSPLVAFAVGPAQSRGFAAGRRVSCYDARAQRRFSCGFRAFASLST
jgi:hypothetical protein